MSPELLDDEDADWFSRRYSNAAEVPCVSAPPGARSIFDADAEALQGLARCGSRGNPAASQAADVVAVPRISRLEPGLIRCSRIAVQDTAEYHAAERARRAKQKPPKGKQIGWKKTRGAKLLGVITTVID